MSNLPPGVTDAMIEAQVRGACGAQSPDGRLACTIECDGEHRGDHETNVDVQMWIVVEPAWAENVGRKPGDLILKDEIGGAPGYVTIARWPQREDDFDEEGQPTKRGTQP